MMAKATGLFYYVRGNDYNPYNDDYFCVHKH